MSIVLVSLTSNKLDGVYRWNMDFLRYFIHAKHYCWNYVVNKYGDVPLTEWEKAKVLNSVLLKDKLIKEDDIVIVDGFWGMGLERHKNVISVCHGNWSYLSYEEVKAGKQPLFPHHHAVQVKYRSDLLKRGGSLVSVSDFVRDDMIKQWGFKSHTINNAIDLNKFEPRIKTKKDRPLIIHGAMTHNKGLDHINFLKKSLKNVDIMLLDEEYKRRNKSEPRCRIIADADLIVSPSTYEGNSYFMLEAMACNVPVVAYNVGLLYTFYSRQDSEIYKIGEVCSVLNRSKETTLNMVVKALDNISNENYYNPRIWVSEYDITNFWQEWERYLSNASKK